MSLSRMSSKRTIHDVEDSDHEEGGSRVESQRSKKSKTEISAEYTGPTNKVLPENIVIPVKPAGRTRIACWNVSGLVACEKKGFKQYVRAENPDILIITETKMNQPSIDPALKELFPHQFWSISAKKGYSGTTIFSKSEPLSIKETLSGHPDPQEVKGRIVTLEFSSCYIVGTYVVNAGQKLQTLNNKKVWNTHFFAYLNELDKTKPVVWAGDFNVAPSALDLANAKKNWNKTAGYTEAEVTAYNTFLNPPEDSEDHKFIDIWRDLHPGKRDYSYFSYRFNCRTKGLGWRIDGFVISERLKERVKMCEIRSEIYGASDHIPMALELEGAL
ncbi:Endonuclease/exonuclease/phosphatase, partial [Crepidotus variabilis]